MIKTRLAIACVFGAMLSFSARASLNGCVEPMAETKNTSVYFASGIDTHPEETFALSTRINIAYKNQFESIDENAKYVFLGAPNETQGFITDVVQVLQQKMNDEQVSGIRAFAVYQLLGSMLNNDEFRAVVSSANPALTLVFTDPVIDKLRDSILQIRVNAMSDYMNVTATHVNLYERDLLAGNRVIVLAHSQGNLFTNSDIKLVRERNSVWADSIDYYGVASPASYTEGDAQYVTADDDRVIQALSLIETVLPTNLDNDPGIFSDFRGTWNHNFLNSYFDPRLKSRASIDINLTRLATEMPYPEKVAGTGAIRATLSWGDQPDVDLHIFEPNGSHVYYLNPVGQDGELDVDDTDGQGPENYFVACDAVNVGTYQFGVNYFHGFVPEHAVVSILVGSGSSVLSREVTLQESRGREGNSTPISIFEVTVADDGRGNAIYNVK